MKRIIILVFIAFSLSGCERIGEYISAKFAQIVPSSSLEQDLKAEQLYKALQQKNEAEVKALIAPSVQAEMQEKPKLLQQIMQMVPNENATAMENIATTRSVNLSDGKTTSVVYLYKYPETTVQFTVVFQGIENSTQIIGFHVNTSISSQTTDSENQNQQHEASQASLVEI